MNSPLDTGAGLEFAYLGPPGSYSQMVARERYAEGKLVPLDTVEEVFDYVEQNACARGVVPIENSSGGLINNTVDGIIEHASSLFIQEELSLDVRLALLGKKGEPITTIFSHFVPLTHCRKYIKRNYPNAKAVPCPSTTASAQAALRTPGGAALGPLPAAELYGLEVLEFPVEKDLKNVTQFFVLGHEKSGSPAGQRTCLVVALPDRPGSLADFLRPFADGAVNLTRIQSRPIAGEPNTYRFLVELAGTGQDAAVTTAIEKARAVAAQILNVGEYPVLPRFQS